MKWGLHRVKWILPHAPEASWYRIDFTRRTEDEPGMLWARDEVLSIVKSEVDRGIPPERIIILGFSQGGAIALLTTLSAPQPYKFACCLAVSTFLPLVQHLKVSESFDGADEEDEDHDQNTSTPTSSVKISVVKSAVKLPNPLDSILARHITPTNISTPFVVQHGTEDLMVPFTRASQTRKVLKDLGFANVRVLTYEGVGHSVSPESLSDILRVVIESVPRGTDSNI
ncbi:hypothetical protein HDU93_007139 [Gonapodya sp. JEL0774]|nr:hypothetical protein HDU93_007139 [Gonapodya sp. JEL0774]